MNSPNIVIEPPEFEPISDAEAAVLPLVVFEAELVDEPDWSEHTVECPESTAVALHQAVILS